MSGWRTLKERLSEVSAQLGRVGEQLNRMGEEVERLQAEAAAQTEPAAVVEEASPGSLELEFVNEALRKLVFGKTQERILEIYLEEAQTYVQRAILFLLKDGRYVTWKGFGFQPDDIRDISLDDPSDSVVRAAQQRQLIYRREHQTDAFPWLEMAGDLPESTFCIPLVFDNSVPVVFYGDSNDTIAIDSLELLTHLAVLVLKNNYLHQLVNAQREAGQPVAPSAEEDWPAETAFRDELPDEEEADALEQEEMPALQEGAEAFDGDEAFGEAGEEPSGFDFIETDSALDAVAEEAVDLPSSQTEVDYGEELDLDAGRKEIDLDLELDEIERQMRFDVGLDSTPEIEDSPQGEEALSAEVEQSPAELEDLQPFESDFEIPTEVFEEAPEEEAIEFQAVDEAEGLADKVEETRFEAELEPPAEAREPAGEKVEKAELAAEEAAYASGLSPDEEKKAHDEARRFARLLVSEIKLYNEDEVEAGRLNGDLYQRLSHDIDRSRETYQKRVHQAVARSEDYFHQEIIRILARGEENLMGSGYPGAR